MNNNEKKPGNDKQQQQDGQKPAQTGDKSGKSDHQQGERKN